MSAVGNSLKSAGLWLLIAVIFVPVPLLFSGVSGEIYVWAVELDLSLPNHLTEVLMLALIATFALVTWAFRRPALRRVLTATAAGLGVVTSYLLSELLKVFLSQERPCRELVAIADCPAVGDWSFPSNHAVIAFAVATGILIITAHRWALSAYLVAAAIAALRVITGAHFPHDVLAGAVLGVCITIAVYLALAPIVERLVRRFAARP